MKNLATKLIISGIFITVLSGLEKILIFMSFQGQGVRDSNTLKNLTPSIIWNITQSTKIFGISILIVGILCIFIKRSFISDQMNTIRIRNAEHEAASNQKDRIGS